MFGRIRTGRRWCGRVTGDNEREVSAPCIDSLTKVKTLVQISHMGVNEGRRPGRSRKRETPLSKWLDEHGEDREKFAAKIGIVRTSLDRICRGDRRPGWELALKIEKATKGEVPVSMWAKLDVSRR